MIYSGFFLCKKSTLFFFPVSTIQENKASIKEESTQVLQRPFNYDVVDVSKGFLTRIAYKKKVKTSKLDNFLERRVKQHVIEEKQRQQMSASKAQAPAVVSPSPSSAHSTPVRPRSPLKPHALVQTQLALDKPVKEEEGESRADLSKTTNENVLAPLPSTALDNTAKDSCSTGTVNSASSQNKIASLHQDLETDLVERTTGPKDTNSDILVQEGVKLGNTEEITSHGTLSSLEPQASSVPSDGAKAAHIENTGSKTPSLKLDSVRTSSVLDQNSSQNTFPSKAIHHNAETLSSLHSCPERNGMGPNENQELTQSDSLKSVSPFPQVNGNDGLGSESMLTNSIMSSNNGELTSSPQPKVNSTGKVEEQGTIVSLKDSAQQKLLVNGDVAPLNDGTEVGVKEPSLTPKLQVESKVTIRDQDYKPPLKIKRLENNTDALGAIAQSTIQQNNTSPFRCVVTKPNPVVKIIRMAPSPIPSAEESSLSDDCTEDSSNMGTTIITQMTTTSTTTTTTAVSTETVIPSALSKACGDTVSTTESSAVSTLTTMTKTTVTKICFSGPDGQSDDSPGETVTQEQKTTLSARICKSTTDTSGKTSVTSVSVSQEDSSSTKGRVRLLKFSRTKKTRSDTALPSYCKFVTKSNRKSIFVLPHDDLKVLARRGGFREVPVFSYNAKPAQDIWPYPSPRPTFGITWR